MVAPHLLASLVAIAEHGSVTAAAESLGLQQPTLSLHLRALRESFDDPLFVRQGGRMLATPRAEALVEPAREILDRLSRLIEPAPAFIPAASDRIFRLAMTDASQVTLLPTILNHFTSHAREVSVDVRLIDHSLAAQLADGKIDLALGHIPWLKECRQRALYSQNWVCLRQRTHATLDRATYESGDHVTVASGTGGHLLEESLAAAGIRRRIRLVLPGFLGLAPIIGNRNYLATIPRHSASTIAAMDQRLEVCELPFAVQGFRVSQYWHERFENEEALIWLRRTLAHLLRNEGARAPDTEAIDQVQ